METYNGSVLVSSGCYNKWLNAHLFLPVLEAGKSKIRVSSDSVSAEGLLTGIQTAVSSLSSHLTERDIISLLSLYMKALTPFLRAPPSWPNYLAKAPTPNTIIWGARASTYEF